MTTEGNTTDPIGVHVERMRAEGIDVTCPSIVGLLRYAERMRRAINVGASTLRSIGDDPDGHYLAD